jgi:hypothetical protein
VPGGPSHVTDDENALISAPTEAEEEELKPCDDALVTTVLNVVSLQLDVGTKPVDADVTPPPTLPVSSLHDDVALALALTGAVAVSLAGTAELVLTPAGAVLDAVPVSSLQDVELASGADAVAGPVAVALTVLFSLHGVVDSSGSVVDVDCCGVSSVQVVSEGTAAVSVVLGWAGASVEEAVASGVVMQVSVEESDPLMASAVLVEETAVSEG